MTTQITFQASKDGLDTRFFFPSTLLVAPYFTNPDATTADIEFTYKGKYYAIVYQGSDFSHGFGFDMSGIVTSATLSVSDDGLGDGTTLGTFTVTTEPPNTLGGAAVDSAAWLTPNNLVLGLKGSQGGAHLSFIGDSGADKLYGSDFADLFNGNAGNDQLTGNGGKDTFIFGKGDDTDTITDFAAGGKGHDIVELSGFDGVNSFKAVQHLLEAHGKDTWFDAGHGDVLIFKHVDIHDLGKGDFLFPG
jgi:Ca2+-binding RTX toxin-like protein